MHVVYCITYVLKDMRSDMIVSCRWSRSGEECILYTSAAIFTCLHISEFPDLHHRTIDVNYNLRRYLFDRITET